MATQNRPAAKGNDAPFSNLVPDEKAAPDYWTHGVPPGGRRAADNYLDRRRGSASLNAGTCARAVIHLGKAMVRGAVRPNVVSDSDKRQQKDQEGHGLS